MRLDEVVIDPRAAWLAMERYVNAGSPSGLAATTSSATSPTDGPATFGLPFYMCPGLSTYTAVPGVLGDLGLPAGFPVHPDLDPVNEGGLGNECEPSLVGQVTVAPTSSGRTVAVVDPTAAPIHIKLHYPRTLGRFTRRIDRRRALAAADTTAILAAPQASLPEQLAFLPEPVALLTPRGTGAMIRSTTPHPVAKSVSLIPLFSLFAADRRRPGDPTLLHQILSAARDPVQLVWERLLCPILDGWTHLALRLGLLPEWNAQNLLVEVDQDARPTRVVFRDLQGTHRDLARRPAWATPLHHTAYRTLGADDESDRAQRSWLFDFKLGDYVLDPLVAGATRSVGEQHDLTTSLRQRLDAHLADAGLDASDLFPRDGATYAQPPGPLRDRRWIEKRSAPPVYRTARGGDR